jgi:23S rRNA (uracil1939-C5)-methyltransferase
MTRKKKPLPLLEGVTIEAVAAEGKCLFHWDDLVVFVPFCVPGDVCDVQIRRKKHSFAEGEVVRFIKYSNVRVKPFCQHFGVCGGCKWQNLPYPEQLKFKQQQVYDQLSRIGKIELPEFRPILGSVKTQEYRNKLDFGCANKRWLTREDIATLGDGVKNTPAIGFHITGAFDKILPIEKCWLMDDLHNQIRNEVRDYAVEHGISFFDLRAQTGLLRDVIIRNSNTGEWLVIIQFHFSTPLSAEGLFVSPPESGGARGGLNKGSFAAVQTTPSPSYSGGEMVTSEVEQVKGLLQHIADKFPQISALMYLDNQKCNDTIGDQDILVFKGNDHIFELMEDLRFKVGPKSFYQTNTEQAFHLYKVARAFALAPMDNGQWTMDNYDYPADNYSLSIINYPLIYDLYTGTGTIANFVAKKARQVIGIEYVPEAIEDAKVNSEINGITNTLFYAGDMKDILTDDFIAEHGRPDVIITDPPRAGMHPDVVKTILRAAPQRIVYVSCNPATQARDLQLLDTDYRVAAVQPVDMFPHTPHVENVVLLIRR